MSKIFKIIIGLILGISVLFAVGYASREYWMGSIVIYAVSDSETTSSYEFLEKTLNSTFEDYKFFTPFKKVYSKLILIQSKIHTCRLATNVYSKKILAFETEHNKGFQINFGPYKKVRFYDLYIFPTDNEYIKISIVGYEGRVKQADIDMLISSINKI